MDGFSPILIFGAVNSSIRLTHLQSSIFGVLNKSSPVTTVRHIVALDPVVSVGASLSRPAFDLGEPAQVNLKVLSVVACSGPPRVHTV